MPTPEAEPPISIRRYPNRRFYDRSRGRYVTLQEIEAIVLEGRSVEVHDSRNGEDITRQVLAQILLERHPRKMELFPVAMLHSVLRANDFAMDLWRGYLRQSLAAMDAWQHATSSLTRPMDWLSALMQGAPTPAPGAEASPPRTGAGPASANGQGGSDVSRRLEEIAARVARLEGEGAGQGEGDKAAPPAAPGEGAIEQLDERVRQLEDQAVSSKRGKRRPPPGRVPR